MKYFDYQSVAREAKIPDQKLEKLVNLIRQEFPNDPMMAELHALRACLAIRDGHIQIDDALKLQAESQV
jgi:mRNA-degrading endonuclease YafQ of YafQ-DinJ toxin-antitoxin module